MRSRMHAESETDAEINNPCALVEGTKKDPNRINAYFYWVLVHGINANIFIYCCQLVYTVYILTVWIVRLKSAPDWRDRCETQFKEWKAEERHRTCVHAETSRQIGPWEEKRAKLFTKKTLEHARIKCIWWAREYYLFILSYFVFLADDVVLFYVSRSYLIVFGFSLSFFSAPKFVAHIRSNWVRTNVLY